VSKQKVHKIVSYSIAIVWVVNGLFCKVLNLVPRHEEIVMHLLNLDRPSAKIITISIGLSEIVMAIWIICGYKPKLNAIAQIAVVATMNILEFIFVPDLLLWGKFNSVFAVLFILIVYFNEFYFHLQLRHFLKAHWY
jgi:uncharacterized membrane protein YphA (DoxX/SURF4 family)